MNQEAFDVYMICAAALFFNLVLLVFATGARRTKSKVFVNAEDAETFKGKHEPEEDITVKRVHAAHRNAIENIPIFLILGLAHVMSGATKSSAIAYFVTFTVARWLHSIFYLRGMQPWRTITFTVGFFATFGLAVRLLVTALT